jgi:acyl carrier protein
MYSVPRPMSGKIARWQAQGIDMDDPIIERIRRLLADIFQQPLENIKEDLAFGDLPQWDSMGHMDVMIALEERFGVEINTDTITELTSLPAICTYLKEKANIG